MAPNDRIGGYTLIEQIGRGGCGTVWLAERRTQIAVTRVALKVLHQGTVNLPQLRHEAQIWARATGHPNILPIIEADIASPGLAYIISEYAPSGTLEDWLKQNGGLAPSPAAALEIAEGTLAALEHLHNLGIIHRDIKPSNILLQGQTPRISDFGISRLVAVGGTTGNISGTLAYMAPEAFAGVRNEATDLWSVSVMLYVMLTGRLPFVGQSSDQRMAAILQGQAAPLPDNFPEALRALLKTALTKDPAQRYRSATELRAAVRGIREQAQMYGVGDISALPDNHLGGGIELGGVYRNIPMQIVAGRWTQYYNSGWVRSGWLFVPDRSSAFAETFFKMHTYPNGSGYIHLLASANPEHYIWLNTATGVRHEGNMAWTENLQAPRTLLWQFTWK